MASPQDPPLVFDDLAIDFAGRRLTRAGQAVALEPKAFDVLALLAGAPGTAFTRDQILDAVWGHRHVTPGVLNRVMTMLRHALGEEANAPRYLHTLHGVGYRFDLPGEAPVAPAPAVQPDPAPRAPPRWPLRPLLVALVVLLALADWLERHDDEGRCRRRRSRGARRKSPRALARNSSANWRASPACA